MTSVRVEAHAKVNLGLAVLGRREDGYHEIDTVLQTVSLSDTITLTPRAGSKRVSLEAEGLDVPLDESNLAHAAARAVMDGTGCGGVHVALRKRIPVGAGLGGGSADAAAVLVGMNTLYNLGLSVGRLRELGAGIGSDVPFLVEGGTARARGRGEVLDRLPPFKGAWFVLATPRFEVSAREAYEAARIGLTEAARFIKVICSGMQEGDLDAVAGALTNDLEAPVLARYPEVGRVRDALLESGALAAVMTGSGPTVLGLARRREDAARTASRLETRDWSLHIVEPIETGCRITERAGSGEV